jgi:hypothetical protein
MILNSTRNFELTCGSTTDYREYRRELVSEHGSQGIEYLDKHSRRGGALGSRIKGIGLGYKYGTKCTLKGLKFSIPKSRIDYGNINE